ncbi:hypothetical protein CDAR_516031 [Caerostris darwini]|uniref:Uncharacterized protein n=1 Tax=Caerostris darwini TaxID=1538125 RepID=A0AAV4NHT0_9ARAC|nr:hypothetical protein CDAR_516031 [Caerostris darwini]
MSGKSFDRVSKYSVPDYVCVRVHPLSDGRGTWVTHASEPPPPPLLDDGWPPPHPPPEGVVRIREEGVLRGCSKRKQKKKTKKVFASDGEFVNAACDGWREEHRFVTRKSCGKGFTCGEDRDFSVSHSLG